MAKQVSVIRLSGTLGEITFYQQDGKDYARRKSKLNRKTVLESKNFERTRETFNEFKFGAHFMKAVRKSLGKAFIGNKNYTSRMNALIYKILDTDTTNIRGQRLCSYAESAGISMLKNFKFLQDSDASDILGFCFFDINDHANSGEYTFQITNLDTETVTLPPTATHFKILSSLGQVHKDNFEYINYKTLETLYLDNASGIYTQEWSISVKAINIEPYHSFQLLRLEYYQEIAGTYYPMQTGNTSVLIFAK